MLTHTAMLVATVIFANIYTSSAFLVHDGLHRVNTRYGEIVGHIENIQFNGKTSQVAKFLGIPFAEPPVGDLRFRKPVPVRNIPTPFAAHSYGPACIQQEYGGIPGITYSEDCLYLNVFVPVNAGQSGLIPKPVMVWIHGGGFILGSAHRYEGNVLSAFSDVIVVTIHYRLGPIGFFSTHDQNAHGNFGLWDQHTAIRWVRDNIQSFGGDRNNITIFGESAGSSSVLYQTLYPGNDGMFQRAIAQSGTVVWSFGTKEANYNASLKFAQTLGCDFTTHEEILNCTRSKSISEIRTAASEFQNYTSDFSPQKWVPVYDDDFVITDPIKMLDQAPNNESSPAFRSHRSKDLLIGANNYDGGVLLTLLFNIYNPDVNITVDDLKRKYIPELISFMYYEAASEISVDAVLNEYSDYTGNTNVMDVLLRMSTDAALNAPMVKTARTHSAGKQTRTYVYQFSVTPPLRFMLLPSYTNGDPSIANHVDEIGYVLGFDPSMFQGVPNFNRDTGVTPVDTNMSKLVMTMWSNFARSG